MPVYFSCEECHQDVLRDCRETLKIDPSHPCLVTTIRKVALHAERVGFSMEDLIHMLQAGLSSFDILELIELRLAGQAQEKKKAASVNLRAGQDNRVAGGE